jgi:hypothetical protein
MRVGRSRRQTNGCCYQRKIEKRMLRPEWKRSVMPVMQRQHDREK